VFPKKLIVLQLTKKAQPLCNRNVHCRFHKSKELVHPNHHPPKPFCKIHFNILFPSTPKYPIGFLPLKFSDRCVLHTSHLLCRLHVLHIPYPFELGLITPTISIFAKFNCSTFLSFNLVYVRLTDTCEVLCTCCLIGHYHPN
jgi:hypothetical protein